MSLQLNYSCLKLYDSQASWPWVFCQESSSTSLWCFQTQASGTCTIQSAALRSQCEFAILNLPTIDILKMHHLLPTFQGKKEDILTMKKKRLDGLRIGDMSFNEM